jgi:tetratricopeptide (TPR) repeat protein
MVHLLCGDLREAQEYFQRALSRLSSLPLTAEANRVHCGLAYLFISKYRLDQATEHARAGLEIAGQIDDGRGLADAHKALGSIAYYRGKLEAASQFYERSLALYRELGDLARTAQASNNVGDCYRRLGHMDRALEFLTEGLELARRIGDTRDEAVLLYTTGELLLDQGRWKAAIARLEQALCLAEESGVAISIVEVHRILGSAYEGVGQLDDGRRHLEIAETLSRDKQQLRFAPRIYLDLARLSATQGEFDEASRSIQLALETAGPEPSDEFLGLLHRCRAYLHSRRGEWGDAVVHLKASLDLLARTKLPAEEGRTRLSLGEAYVSRGAEGDGERAREQWLAALSIFRQIEARGYVAQVDLRLAEIGS